MPDYIDISRYQLNKLIKEFNFDTTPTSGATLVHPGFYPSTFKEIGINPRDSKRNRLLGSITSKLPNRKDIFMIGISYEDNLDDNPNEDFFEILIDEGKVIKYKSSEFEKKFPEYEGMHKDMKLFFYE